mgnify:CR=1 FL=1
MQYQSENRTRCLRNKVKEIMQKETIDTHSKNESNGNIEEYRDSLKQKLSVMSERLRRYKTSKKRRVDTRMFYGNEK